MASPAPIPPEKYSLDQILYQHTALIESLEHILFGNVQNRSRDELEDRAAEAIAAWNEK